MEFFFLLIKFSAAIHDPEEESIGLLQDGRLGQGHWNAMDAGDAGSVWLTLGRPMSSVVAERCFS